MTKEELEEIWRKEVPSCCSCGWSNAFYEVEDVIVVEEETEERTVYWAPCCRKDGEGTDHRGYWLYVPKDK